MLQLTRREDESWYDALLRYAKPYGMAEEVDTVYSECVNKGMSEADAAFEAAYTWDLLDVTE